MKSIARFFAMLFSWGLTGFILGSMFLITGFYHYSKGLPDYSALAEYDPAGMTRVYASDGRLMAEYAKEKRIFMPLIDMPKRVVHAFVAAEDKSFYRNQGIDPYGVARAVISNIKSIARSERSLVGGSTITQQVVKNFLLNPEKTIHRKIREAILALRITSAYSKDKIMELYLNEIYLGFGAYGVASAAQRYFDKTLDELNTEEIALLAAMPKAPALLDPRKNYDGALDRRNYVLDRMYQDGYINVSESERAKSEPIILGSRDDVETVRGGYFAEEVRRSLGIRFGDDKVDRGGLYVKTTMIPKMQEYAETALRNALIKYDLRHGYRGPVEHIPLNSGNDWLRELEEVAANVPVFGNQKLVMVRQVEKGRAIVGMLDGKKAVIPFSNMSWAKKYLAPGKVGIAPKSAKEILRKGDVVLTIPVEKDETSKNGKMPRLKLIQIPEINGALVAMNPHNGHVIAMAGGYNSFEHFNRATQARRQPGSCFKPFVFLAALERGFTPSTIIVDEPIEVPQGPGKPLWRPKNFGGDFIGPATLRVGLERSRNIITVKIAKMLDIERIVRVGARFGIYKNPPANYSMVLGSIETSLLELVTGYAMIVNGGIRVDSTLIERVDDHDGALLYRADQRICSGCVASDRGRILSLKSPPEPRDNRERVVDPRVAYQMVSILRGVVERGTAKKARVLDFPVGGKTGTTNDSRDAWFVGFSPDLVVGVYIGFDKPRSLGKRETGGKVALPAFIDFMQMAYQDLPKRDFEVPPGISQVKVDRYTGVPPLPWSQGGQIISEAFIEGGSVFIPEGEDDGLSAAIVPQEHYSYTPPSNEVEVYEPDFNEDPRGYVRRKIEDKRRSERNRYSTRGLGDDGYEQEILRGERSDENKWRPIDSDDEEVKIYSPTHRYKYQNPGRERRIKRPREDQNTGTGGLF